MHLRKKQGNSPKSLNSGINLFWKGTGALTRLLCLPRHEHNQPIAFCENTHPAFHPRASHRTRPVWFVARVCVVCRFERFHGADRGIDEKGATGRGGAVGHPQRYLWPVGATGVCAGRVHPPFCRGFVLCDLPRWRGRQWPAVPVRGRLGGRVFQKSRLPFRGLQDRPKNGPFARGSGVGHSGARGLCFLFSRKTD